MFTEEKPPLDELVHYGVKGMKRGVRKKRKETPQQRRSRELHERVQREQGRVPGTKQKTATVPPGAAKKMQKLQNLKSMKFSQLNKKDYQDLNPEQKRVARLTRENESLKKLTRKQKEARWRQLKKEGKLGDKYAKELVSW